MQTARTSTPIKLPRDVADSPASSLTSQIAQKQRELSEMHELQVKALILDVAAKDDELKKTKEAHEALVNDFKYNLTLITERDEELEKFEEALNVLRSKLHTSESALSESKVKFASLEEALRVKTEHYEGKCDQLNKRIKDMKAEILAMKWNHSQDVKRLQETIEENSRQMSDCLADRDRMIEKERSDVILEFETKLRMLEEESRSRNNELNKQLKDSQLKLVESNRHRERALDDISKLQQKILDMSSAHSKELEDTRKDIWESEAKVRQYAERIEEQQHRHEREVELEHGKIKALQQRLTELESRLNLGATSHQHALDKAQAAHVKVTAELEAEASSLKQQVEHYTQTLNTELDRNYELQQKLQSLEFSLGEQERTKQQLLTSFEKQIRTLESAHKESIQQVAKELNDRDSSLLAITADKSRAEEQAQAFKKEVSELASKCTELQRVVAQKESEVSELRLKCGQLQDSFDKMKQEYEDKLKAFRPYESHISSPHEASEDGLGPSISPPRLPCFHSPLRPAPLATQPIIDEFEDISPPRLDNRFSFDVSYPNESKTIEVGSSNANESRLEELEAENRRLRLAISTMKQDAVEIRELMKSTMEGNDNTEVIHLRDTIDKLEKKLEETESERDKLMAATNALRGDLMRFTSQSMELNATSSEPAPHVPPNDYIDSLEEATQELVSRNTTLRREVRRLEKLLKENEVISSKHLRAREERHVCNHSEFDDSRIGITRLQLLKPAILGLFETTGGASPNKARLNLEELAEKFCNDTQAAQLLLGNVKGNPAPDLTSTENIANRAQNVLRALGLRAQGDQPNVKSGYHECFLVDVSAEELVCLWAVWSALGVYGVHAGMLAFFEARSSFATPADRLPPPPAIEAHSPPSERPPQPPARSTENQARRKAPRTQPKPEAQHAYQPRVVRNYNDMRP